MSVSEVIPDEDFFNCKEKGNLWIAINNSVYNIRNFLNEHPGGSEVLLECVGKDATEPFEDVCHSTDAKQLLKKFKIGELIEGEMELLDKESLTSETVIKIGFSVVKYVLITTFIIFVAVLCYQFLDVLLDY